MQLINKFNKGSRYWLCAIDIYRKHACVIPLKDKTKSWLEKNDIELYSAYDEGKSVTAKKFITTLKNKIYK